MNTEIPTVSLVVDGGPHDGRVIPILPPFLIGRAPECNLRPSSAFISIHHCVIEIHEGQVILRDLGSRNGTFLNEDRLLNECPLCDGDELLVGPLRFFVRSDRLKRRSGGDTVVALRTTDETSIVEDRMTEDEEAKLLLSDDEEDIANPTPARHPIAEHAE
jgi:pSer/pThr/pTyr-binding forkhead associated (FHA) protein